MFCDPGRKRGFFGINSEKGRDLIQPPPAPPWLRRGATPCPGFTAGKSALIYFSSGNSSFFFWLSLPRASSGQSVQGRDLIQPPPAPPWLRRGATPCPGFTAGKSALIYFSSGNSSFFFWLSLPRASSGQSVQGRDLIQPPPAPPWLRRGATPCPGFTAGKSALIYFSSGNSSFFFWLSLPRASSGQSVQGRDLIQPPPAPPWLRRGATPCHGFTSVDKCSNLVFIRKRFFSFWLSLPRASRGQCAQ
ncbi:hypothetical protein Dthio_PD3672 [Desulfonatronospira thiodismutans ASO3-1]|uniref:Uncharacterized protein n=1 Tax=Desulfonatronospira thiodismutans ASO3-1 TaxID=555779 RepID=D6SK12_9BACT|nr:hypothetical protein Dthio_PD3672 [Desulfonatronospira thiodismutans ASO3-1]